LIELEVASAARYYGLPDSVGHAVAGCLIRMLNQNA